MAIKYWFIFFILSSILFTGCGLLYTNVTKPYSADFNNTPIGSKQCTINIHKIREPITGYGIYVEWNADEIRNAAKKAGITKIYYIDLRTFSILLGIYRKKTLIVYGD